jgi:hypothetical protein
VNNSIGLKELQVEYETLKKRGQGVRFFSFLFHKGFFWVKRGRWGNFTPLQRRFFSRDWYR